MEEQMQLCQFTRVYGIHVKPSTIEATNTFVLLFSTKHFAQGELIVYEYEYEIPVHSDAVTLIGLNET